MQKVIKNVSTETNISNALHLVETILLDFYGDFVEIGILNLTYYQPLRETCQWINKISKDDRRKTSIIFELFRKTLLSISKLNAAFGNITKTYNKKIHNVYMRTIVESLQLVQGYLNGTCSKKDLSEIFTKMFIKETDNLFEYCHHLNGHIKEFSSEINCFGDNLLLVFKELLQLRIPIINVYNIQQLELVQEAAALNDASMSAITDNLKTNVSNILDLITESVSRILKPVTDLKHSITQPIEEVLEMMEDLEISLQLYEASLKMNTEFFM